MIMNNPNQSTIPNSAYIERKGSLKVDTVEKLKAAGKQLVPKKIKLGIQGKFDV